LQKVSHKYQILIISISKPLLIGVYRDNILIDKISTDKKASDVLLNIIYEIIEKYNVNKIIYTSSPGSYMAIKLTYIILKTIQIIKDIPIFGCSGFSLNQGNPIKAIGNLYFIKEKETIITKKYEQLNKSNFELPTDINNLILNDNAKPNYLIPAV